MPARRSRAGIAPDSTTAPEPGGVLQATPVPPIGVAKRLRPERITLPAPGVYIAAMGQNFSGWTRFTLDVPKGTDSKRWLGLVQSQTHGFILKRGLHDHERLEGEKTAPMVTPLYCESARVLSQLTPILGRKENADTCDRLAEQIKTAYTDQFLAVGTGVVTSGIQSLQAFALTSTCCRRPNVRRPLQRLVRDIDEKHDGHLTTGIFGTKYMLDVLSRDGRIETAYQVPLQYRLDPLEPFLLQQEQTGDGKIDQCYRQEDSDPFAQSPACFIERHVFIIQLFMPLLQSHNPTRVPYSKGS